MRKQVCSKCRQAKPATTKHFYASPKATSGLTSWCKRCHSNYTNAYNKRNAAAVKKRVAAWRKANPEKVEAWRIANKLHCICQRRGITVAIYNAMLRRQRGRCALCREPMKRPNLDHCHTTGRVRGLLCHGCNTALGKFNDCPKMLQRAIDYLLS